MCIPLYDDKYIQDLAEEVVYHLFLPLISIAEVIKLILCKFEKKNN